MDPGRAQDVIAAQAPRKLRLGELLRELGADDEAAEPAAPAESAAEAEAAAQARPQSITVGELVDKASEGGFGFLIAILALIAIPFFGLSTPFGLAIALIGAQLMLGMQRPWLPQRARRRPLSMAMLDRVASLLARRTRWLAKACRRRWEFVIMPRAIGAGVVLLALGLALPLPIPGSNLVFLIPLFIYALGLLERDGLWIAIGHLCLLVDLVLMIVFAGAIWMVFVRLAHWLWG